MAAALSPIGTDGYLPVYQSEHRRLADAMLLLAAAILAVPTIAPATPQRQATASVRILRVQPIHFQEIERQQPGLLRSTSIRARDGRPEPARLLEYQ
jgi:hypothetical protein